MWILYLLLFIVGAAVAAAVAALYLSYLAVAGLLAAIVAVAAYGLGMPAAYLRGLGEVLAVRSAGRPGPESWPQSREDDDPAVLEYFYGPARADAVHSIAIAYRLGQAQWRRGARAVRSFLRADLLVATAPLGIGSAIGMAAGTAAGTVVAAGCAVVYLVNVAIGTAAVRASAVVLRGIDSALLRIKNIRIVCTHCGERVPYPGYACPACLNRHQDIRPGRLGVLRRYCNCGSPMSTLLLFGSASMNAFCPICGTSLPHRPGEAPEIVLPVFGATGAGKTRLAAAMVTQLMTWATTERLTAEPGNPQTISGLAAAASILGSDPAEELPPAGPPTDLVARATSGKATRILHFFDASGRHFRDAEGTEELPYLGEARTFILVIDPLAADASPDQAYHHTYQQIEAMGVPLRDTRLAVAMSRSDVTGAPGGDPQEWASTELGLSNLIISAGQNFGETRFFCTAAVLDADGAVHESIAPLLRWVLAGSGLSLPEEGTDG
jgi:Double-GTPase 2